MKALYYLVVRDRYDDPDPRITGLFKSEKEAKKAASKHQNDLGYMLCILEGYEDGSFDTVATAQVPTDLELQWT